jgi:hypothetical protein
VACSVVRSIKLFVMQETLKMVYHSYFHSIINYEINFWGRSPHSNSIFELQKRIIRIIVSIGIRDSCRELIKILHISPLISQYTYSLAVSVANNKNQFTLNYEIHSINTRNNSDFFQPLSHLTVY